jgi:hypothetical protein
MQWTSHCSLVLCRCKSCCCDAPRVVATLQHYSSRGCVATALQLAWLRCCGAIACVATFVATLLWVKWEDETPTPKVGDLESSGTPECLEFDRRGQNTSHWGVLGVIEKVLKRRYRKWPRIGHLDICSPSYGQKKGRESNWQFDPRPLKVGNRPLPDIWIGSATWRWKAIEESYNFGWDLVLIRLGSSEIWAPKVSGLQPEQFRDNFGTPTWESREKEPFGCSPSGVL